MGAYNSYLGGGYVYEMRGQLKYLQGNLSLLQEMAWIDRQTRAVFAEFTVYNPNINLLCVVTILVEFLATGNIIKSARMEPLSLFNDSEANTLMTTITGVLYMTMIVFFMIREILKIYKSGLAYFKQFWNYVEWMIIAFSWATFAMYLYRLVASYTVRDFLKKHRALVTLNYKI